MNERLKKELIDQTAHFGAGFLATLAIGYFAGGVIAAVVVMIFAVSREIKQRLERNDVWYGCAWGCRLDLLFWALGAGGAALLLFIYFD